MPRTASIVAGGTAAVMLLGVATSIVLRTPATAGEGLGGPLVVTAPVAIPAPPATETPVEQPAAAATAVPEPDPGPSTSAGSGSSTRDRSAGSSATGGSTTGPGTVSPPAADPGGAVSVVPPAPAAADPAEQSPSSWGSPSRDGSGRHGPSDTWRQGPNPDQRGHSGSGRSAERTALSPTAIATPTATEEESATRSGAGSGSRSDRARGAHR